MTIAEERASKIASIPFRIVAEVITTPPLLKKLLGFNPQITPPPGMAEEEFVEMMARESKWARGLSSAVCGTPGTPGYEACVEAYSKHLIRKITGLA